MFPVGARVARVARYSRPHVPLTTSDRNSTRNIAETGFFERKDFDVTLEMSLLLDRNKKLSPRRMPRRVLRARVLPDRKASQ